MTTTNNPKLPSRAYLRYRAARLLWVSGRCCGIGAPLLLAICAYELVRKNPSIVFTVKAAP